MRDPAGSPATEAGVIVFPQEPDQWIGTGFNPRRILTARASSAGEFRVPALPAGAYYVAAVPIDRLDDWREPGFLLRAQSRAERVTIGWGEGGTRDVRLLQPW